MICSKLTLQIIICVVDRFCRNWQVVQGQGWPVNHILGLLVCKHYPGLVQMASVREPAYTFDHYAAASDTEYGNKAQRVRTELLVSLLGTKSHRCIIL